MWNVGRTKIICDYRRKDTSVMDAKKSWTTDSREVEMWGGWNWFASVERKDMSATGSKKR